jgi:hypothetical protein
MFHLCRDRPSTLRTVARGIPAASASLTNQAKTSRFDVQGEGKMNRKIIGAALGLAILAASSAASAHVDVAVGVGIPVAIQAPPPPVLVERPVVYGPAPVAVDYRDDDDWRERRWRERREWREHEWRREHWREHEAREHRRWGDY